MQFNIPIDPSKPVDFKDASGVTYSILPVVGELEYEITGHARDFKKSEGVSAEQFQDMLVDKLVVAWKADFDLPLFPSDNRPSRFLNQSTKDRLIAQIMAARDLTDEEKKT